MFIHLASEKQRVSQHYVNTSYPTGQCLLTLGEQMRLSVSLFPRPGTLLERFIVLVLVFFNRPVQLHFLGRSSSMATRVPRLPQGLDVSDFAWGGIISILGGPPFKTLDYWKPGIFASSDCSQASSCFYQCPKRRDNFCLQRACGLSTALATAKCKE